MPVRLALSPLFLQLRHKTTMPPRGTSGSAAAATAKAAALADMQTSSSNSFAALADHEQGGEEAGSASSSRPDSGSGAAKRDKRLRDPLVWIDLEMTGLEPEQHTIIEIAVILTDGDLRVQIEGPALVIHQPEAILDGMNEWSKEQHGKSGLTQRVRDSELSMREAEEKVLEFVRQRVPDAGVALLAGNSVHCDRMFLLKYMPELAAHLSYRIVDVSTIKELAKRWYPAATRKAPRKACAHTALSDIRESIAELMYYRKAIFK